MSKSVWFGATRQSLIAVKTRFTFSLFRFSYDDVMVSANMTTNKELGTTVDEYEDDFM